MILKNFIMIFQNIINKYDKMYILRIFVLYYYIYITIYIILIIRGFLGKWSECLIANLRVSGSNLDLDRTFLDFLYGNSKIS